MKHQIVLATIALALVSENSHAAGLLGEKYMGFSYDHASVESIDAWGASFEYNRPIGSDNQYAYDFNLQLGYAELDEDAVEEEVSGKDIDAHIVFYPIKNFELKPFLAAGIGYGEATLLGDSDDSFKYSVVIGGEWRASDTITIAPYWRFFDYTDLDEGSEEVVGIMTNLWIKYKYGVGLDFSRMSESGYDLDIISATFRLRF